MNKITIDVIDCELYVSKNHLPFKFTWLVKIPNELYIKYGLNHEFRKYRSETTRTIYVSSDNIISAGSKIQINKCKTHKGELLIYMLNEQNRW